MVGTVAVRYAKSVFALAKETNQLDAVKADMELLQEAFAEMKELKAVLENPLLSESKKIEIFAELLKGKVCDLTFSLIKLVINNKREEMLIGITLDFLKRYREEKGIKQAQFTSATKVDSKIISKIKDILSEHYNAEIDILEKVDERLIGGYVLTIDDLQYNASVKAKLNKIKTKLLQA